MNVWYGFLEALRLLTVVHVPATAEQRQHGRPWAAVLFPVVGLFLGLVLAGVMALALPTLPAAALTLAVWVLVTGGIHEAGWADCVEAAVAGRAGPRRSELPGGPAIGRAGSMATGLLMLLRFAALTVITPAAVVVAPVVGRWAMVVSVSLAPPAGGGDAEGGHRSHSRVLIGTTGITMFLVLLVAAWTVQPGLMLVWPLAGLIAGAGGWWLASRLGGLNSDGHRAIGILAETCTLYATILLASL